MRSAAQMPTLTRVEQKHGGQLLLEDSVGQLRWLSRRGVCVLRHSQIAALSPVQLPAGSTLLSANFTLGTFEERRQPGHQDAASSQPVRTALSETSFRGGPLRCHERTPVLRSALSLQVSPAPC